MRLVVHTQTVKRKNHKFFITDRTEKYNIQPVISKITSFYQIKEAHL